MAAVQDAIDRLNALQKSQNIQVVELGESIRPQKNHDAGKRNSAVSDVSAEDAEDATPAALQAELQHYKELFSKLRFSYVDQVTKEKFLTAITVDPPLLVEPQENIELEAQLAQVKASLKAQKVEVVEMIAELERRGRELSKRYESVELRTSQLSTLPSEIAGLEAAIEELRETQAPHPTNPSLSLPLPATQALVASKESEITALDNQIASLQAALPRKARELERLEAELKPLELQRNGTVSAAEEAKRRRDAGEAGMGDDLEERGRWLRAVSQGLKTMLEVEG